MSLNTKMPESFSGNNFCLSVTEISHREEDGRRKKTVQERGSLSYMWKITLMIKSYSYLLLFSSCSLFEYQYLMIVTWCSHKKNKHHPSLMWSILAHLVEVVSNNFPDPGPLQSDAAHVVVGDLDYFLQAEHTWVCGRGQLIHGHSTQPAHKINWQIDTRCWQWAKKSGALYGQSES